MGLSTLRVSYDKYFHKGGASCNLGSSTLRVSYDKYFHKGEEPHAIRDQVPCVFRMMSIFTGEPPHVMTMTGNSFGMYEKWRKGEQRPWQI